MLVQKYNGPPLDILIDQVGSDRSLINLKKLETGKKGVLILLQHFQHCL